MRRPYARRWSPATTVQPESPRRCLERRLAHMSVGVAITLGAVLGLALGIVVSVTTEVPFAPEVGLGLGALVGWLSRRENRRRIAGSAVAFAPDAVVSADPDRTP